MAMPEEALQEIAATGERQEESPRGLASPEFFFLLQRIDHLEEKMEGRFRRLEENLNGKLEALANSTNNRFEKIDQRFEKIDSRFEKIEERFGKIDSKLGSINRWAIGAVIGILAGFVGTIVTLLLH